MRASIATLRQELEIANADREAAIQRAVRQQADENAQLRSTVQALRDQVDQLAGTPGRPAAARKK